MTARSFSAIGLMSGTSMDGIDVAHVFTDGDVQVQAGPGLFVPYDDGFRDRLRGVLGRNPDAHALAEAAAELTRRHAQAVEAFLAREGMAPDRVDVVGFHGQTTWHAPAEGQTRQIGDGQALADRLGIPVVCDFRSDDVAAGGEGAPLVPLYHAALASEVAERPLAVVNIGGVANLTYIGIAHEPEAALLAGDTGPGNALLDDWMLRHIGTAVDAGGAAAAAGRVSAAQLAGWMVHPFFQKPLPRSLDRNAFAALQPQGVSLEDGAATLTAFTAASIAATLPLLPAPPQRWLVCGGGRHNPVLMAMLAERLQAPVEPVEAVGWDGDLLEAQAFAYLAVRSLRGLPLTLPGTTGVRAAMTGGRHFAPSQPARRSA